VGEVFAAIGDTLVDVLYHTLALVPRRGALRASRELALRLYQRLFILTEPSQRALREAGIGRLLPRRERGEMGEAQVNADHKERFAPFLPRLLATVQHFVVHTLADVQRALKGGALGLGWKQAVAVGESHALMVAHLSDTSRRISHEIALVFTLPRDFPTGDISFAFAFASPRFKRGVFSRSSDKNNFTIRPLSKRRGDSF
jgi:hypothetical protein